MVLRAFAAVPDMGFHCAFHYSAGGAPRLAMWCNIIPAAVNIVLDWLFVFPLGLGVTGAAAATTISLVIGGCISSGYLLFRARHLRPVVPKWSRKSLRLSLRNIGYQCRIGSSALLGESTMAILMFIGNKCSCAIWVMTA